MPAGAIQVLTPNRPVHRGGVSCAACSPAGPLIVTGWPTWISAVAYIWDGKALLVAGTDGVLRLRRAADGGPAYPNSEQVGPALLVALAPDGGTIAACDQECNVALWSVARGVPLWSRHTTQDNPWSLAFSPAGNRLLLITHERNAVLLDPRTGAEVRLETPDGPIKVDGGSAFSPDGSMLAAVDPSQGDIKLWDAATGRLLRTLALNQFSTLGVAWAPDGKRLVTGSPDGKVRIWGPRTGKLLATLAGHQDKVAAVAVSPDGLLLASADLGGEVRLWDLFTGAGLWRSRVPTVALAVGFAADGRTVLARERVDTVHFFDGFRGEELGALPLSKVHSMALTPDAARLATGHEDGCVVVWKTAALGKTPPRPTWKLSAARIEELWDALAGPEAEEAHEARWKLAGSPELALPLLKARLRAEPPLGADRLRRLISDLDHTMFKKRVAATDELARLGESGRRSASTAVWSVPDRGATPCMLISS